MVFSVVNNTANRDDALRRRRDASVGRPSSSGGSSRRRDVPPPRPHGRTRRPRQAGATAALASVAFACLLSPFVPRASPSLVSAFTVSRMPPPQPQLLSAATSSPFGSAAARQQQPQQRQRQRRRRARTRCGASSATMMAAAWREKEEGPAVDPFDVEKMGALGQHVINWCVFWAPPLTAVVRDLVMKPAGSAAVHIRTVSI